ncbi:MAG: DUF2169 domain-containing protein [Rubrivivax sp.]|nr:MAG: DUF2169 domain-containing protein [Rubrivivax sp.]
MWQVDNRTPFAVERSWVRDRDGTEIWLVAVKATFDILPDGSTQIAQEQPPVLRLPEHHADPTGSSIKYDADLVLRKTTTDILVVGHACAPDGQEVTQLDCGFKVGPVQKILRVFGDRRWGSFGPSAPQPFSRMPLTYERAYGGVDRKSSKPDRDWDWRNPVGTGFAVADRHAVDLPLPNIEYPEQLIRSWRDRPPPAGFGAIASNWQPRVGFAGTYDQRWQKTRAPLLAEDMDERWYQCAPADQQAAEFLRGGEPVILHNLHPRRRIEFKLPRLYLGFDTRFYDGSRELHRERALHTVILEPDFPRVSLVWQSALPCHFKVHKLDRTVVILKSDRSLGEAAFDDSDLAVS